MAQYSVVVPWGLFCSPWPCVQGASQELWEHGHGAGQAGAGTAGGKTGGSKRITYNVLCNEQLTVNIVYGNGSP